ncbi:MAG: PrsW family glutamic-type intramembrane protease [Defluviitaleaceae bacterium]|nr:PrsW family glutamic-type intramembrane protease [Defluviitaleaceae bacterium]
MILFNLAVAPAFAILLFTYIKDKHKEPIGWLVTFFLAGILIAVPAALLSSLDIRFANIRVLPASVSEEIFKFLALILLTKKNKHIEERYDFIICAVFIAMGFATFENILYIFNDSLGGMSTAITRAIFSVPAHAMFAAIMGYFLGKRKYFLSLASAIVLHTGFNAFLRTYPHIFYIYFIFLGFFLIFLLKKIHK